MFTASGNGVSRYNGIFTVPDWAVSYEIDILLHLFLVYTVYKRYSPSRQIFFVIFSGGGGLDPLSSTSGSALESCWKPGKERVETLLLSMSFSRLPQCQSWRNLNKSTSS